MMIKVAICDDEAYVLKGVEKFVENHAKNTGYQCVIVKFTGGSELIQYMRTNILDLIILDILMPGKDGMDIAKDIRRLDEKVRLIFLTSVTNLAKEGYKVSADSYLTKPLKYKEFASEMDRIYEKMTLDNESNRYLVVKSGFEIIKIYFKDIIYIETERKHTNIHTNSRAVTSYNSMQAHMEQLNREFFRCHRAYIVNFAYVQELSGATVIMKNGERIPISKHYYKEIREAFTEYLGNKL